MNRNFADEIIGRMTEEISWTIFSTFCLLNISILHACLKLSASYRKSELLMRVLIDDFYHLLCGVWVCIEWLLIF